MKRGVHVASVGEAEGHPSPAQRGEGGGGTSGIVKRGLGAGGVGGEGDI